MVETKINKLIEIISKLRDPNFGCEWTKIQNSESLLPFLKEEVEEVVEAIEKKDFQNLKDELGDLLLQIVLHSQINDENNKFSFEEVVDNLCEKLIRRHPYVFDEKRPHTIEDQRKAYFRIKDLEKTK